MGLAAGVAVVVTILLVAFAWPAAQTAPRHLPIAVGGPDDQVRAFVDAIGKSQPGAYEVTVVPDAAAMRELVLDREVYGGVLLDPEAGPQVVVASAAGPAVAELLRKAATAPGQARGSQPVVDLVPLPKRDPQGWGFAAAIGPLVLGGVLLGLVFSPVGPGRRAPGASRVAAGPAGTATGVVLGSVLIGLAAELVLHTWLGLLVGPPAAAAAAIALAVAAEAAVVAGVGTVAGGVGAGLAGLVVLAAGGSSGATGAPELLPAGAGMVGRVLPPGALVSLLRGLSGFDGARSWPPVIALAVSLMLGTGLLTAAALGARSARLGSAARPDRIDVDAVDRPSSVAAASADGAPADAGPVAQVS